MSAQAAALRTRSRAQGRDLKVVRRRSRKLVKPTSRGASTVIVVAIAAAAIVFGILLEQVVLAQSAFKLTRLRNAMAEAEALHEELLLEAAKLDNDERIERYAREELGMVDPAPGTVRYIVAGVGRGPARSEDPRLAYPIGSNDPAGVTAAVEGTAP